MLGVTELGQLQAGFRTRLMRSHRCFFNRSASFRYASLEGGEQLMHSVISALRLSVRPVDSAHVGQPASACTLAKSKDFVPGRWPNVYFYMDKLNAPPNAELVVDLHSHWCGMSFNRSDDWHQ
jgi:hypothetical protein